MSLEDQKKAARAAAFQRRKVAFDTQSGDPCALLNDVLSGFQGAATAGFMPINTEIDPTPAMAMASKTGPVGVPVIMAAATPLKFAEWTPNAEMVEGAF